MFTIQRCSGRRRFEEGMRSMGNLGPYEVFTTAAKAAGGVEALIKQIEEAAAKRALPKTVALTALGTVAVGGLFLEGAKRYRSAKNVREERAEEAKRKLKSLSEESAKDDNVD
ncbi:hypothetical protein [Streptomyces sp. NPDC059957]|uniref:hypothetical protein n=1 Tax=unclassified Streptomyces TaxID=2593676 RepID=UPI003651957A